LLEVRMRQTVSLGRIAGIPVGASWSAIVTLAVIVDLLAGSALPAAVPRQPAALYWAVGTATAVAFLASLLAHELAHALVARRNGIRIRSVTLWMLGGVTQLDGDPGTPRADLQIALAGPAASLLTGAVFLGVAVAISSAGAPRFATSALIWLALMNGVLGVFNLLPGAPLDGGRVLRAALWHHWADRQRADRGAASAGRAIGTSLAILGVLEVLLTRDLVGGLWLVLLGWFMTSAAAAEQGAATARALLAGVRVADVMTPDPDLAAAWLTAAEFIGQLGGRSAQTAFPVIGPDGRLTGIVTVTRLSRVPAASRDLVHLQQLAAPVPEEYLASPADPAAQLLSREPLSGEVVAVVEDGGHITGLVTVENMRHALRWRKLAGTTAAQAIGGPSPRG
jgi:Zn-dependent protease/CBS domain-containing protein